MRFNLLIAALAGTVLMTAPAFAHRQHAGVTEININEQTQEMEIIHRLYWEDLLVAMDRDNRDEAVYFTSEDGLAEIGAYVESLFRFADGTGLLFETNYIGAEMDGEYAWVYFIAPIPDVGAGFAIDNDILSDRFEDQSMMTNLHFSGQVRTALQGPGHRQAIRLSFE